MAEEAVASFGFDAEDDGDEEHSGPGNGGRQAGIAAESGEGLVGGLAGGNPPRKNGRETSGENEGKKFAADPTFESRHGFVLANFAPHEKLPGEKRGGERHPAVESGFQVEPEPGAKEELRGMRGNQPREDKPSGQGVGDDGEEQDEESEELHPLLRGSFAATRADGALRQNLQAAILAIHGRTSLLPRADTQQTRPLYSAQVEKSY